MRKIGIGILVVFLLALSAMNLRDMLSGVKLPGGEKAKVIVDSIKDWGYDTAYASPATKDITLTVTCRYLCVTVNPTSYGFGILDSGTSTISTYFDVENCGSLAQTYQLMQRTPADWSHTTGTPGTDQYRLFAIFRQAAPVVGNFADNDIIGGNVGTNTWTPGDTVGISATSDFFAVDGSGCNTVNSGCNVPPDAANDNRNLWFRIDTPAVTEVTAQQEIIVRIRAIAP